MSYHDELCLLQYKESYNEVYFNNLINIINNLTNILLI